jgi:hypothetical protein
MHNSWDKNDPKDAQVILHMLKTGLSQTWHDPLVSGTNDAQELSKTHHQVTLARTRVWHRLRNHYFPLYFPEIEHFIRSDHSDWLIQLLLRFPTPGSITSLAAEDFVAQAWGLVGRKVHKAALLAEIYAAAQRSIALPVPPDGAAVAMLRLVLEEYLMLGRMRESIAQQAEIILASNADRRRLMTVPGVGPLTALTILAEAGDLRFAAELLKHAVFADPDDPAAREALAGVYERLGYGSENATWRSFYLTGALELREGAKPPPIGDLGAGMAGALTIGQLFDSLAIRVDGPRAAGQPLIIDWEFSDTGTTVRLTLSNGALIQTVNPRREAAAALTLRLSKAQLLGLLAGHGLDGIEHTGDPAALGRLLALLDTPDSAFPVVTP